MVKLHGTPVIMTFFPVVVLHKLRITVRFLDLKAMVSVMMQEGKAVIAAGMIYFFKLPH